MIERLLPERPRLQLRVSSVATERHERTELRPGRRPAAGVARLVADGHARFLGPSRLAKAFPTWFDTTVYSRNLRRGEHRRLRDAVPA